MQALEIDIYGQLALGGCCRVFNFTARNLEYKHYSRLQTPGVEEIYRDLLGHRGEDFRRKRESR